MVRRGGVPGQSQRQGPCSVLRSAESSRAGAGPDSVVDRGKLKAGEQASARLGGIGIDPQGISCHLQPEPERCASLAAAPWEEKRKDFVRGHPSRSRCGTASP